MLDMDLNGHISNWNYWKRLIFIFSDIRTKIQPFFFLTLQGSSRWQSGENNKSVNFSINKINLNEINNFFFLSQTLKKE